MMPLVYIAAGGAIGSVMRYLMVTGVSRLWPVVFPYGILVVNVLGSFTMGVLAGYLTKYAPENQEQLRLFIAVGILGGFTTFSAFSLDVVTLIEGQQLVQATLYVMSSIGLGVVALILGLYLMRVVG